MLSFLKKIFGAEKPEATAAPYKVEKSTAKIDEFPFPETKPAKAVKKPAVKKATTRKPRAPKA